VAGATLMPSTLSIIRAMFGQARQRTTAIAAWGAMATAGAAAGPLVGGLLLEHFWWSSVFAINVPVMVVLVVLGIRFIPESRDPHPGPFDPTSAVLSMAGIVPIVYAVKELAGGEAGLGAAMAAAAGIAAVWLFVRRQRRRPHPLIDIGLFRRPAFAGAVGTNLLAIFALSGLLFFLSQYLQLVRGYESSTARCRLRRQHASKVSVDEVFDRWPRKARLVDAERYKAVQPGPDEDAELVDVVCSRPACRDGGEQALEECITG
jgi:MFS transporter, DHA2 family, multidrug resistance protein